VKVTELKGEENAECMESYPYRKIERKTVLATLACSALVKEVINLGKEATLWVAEDNLLAKRVYEKIGFQKQNTFS